MQDNKPQVGIGVMVFKDKKILLGKRKGAHGEGCYGLPAGKLEYMESIVDCAIREVSEETGLKVNNILFLRVLNFKHASGKHFLDLCLTADWEAGEPQVLESDKCEKWDWYDLDHLPSPLFEPVPSAIEAYISGKNFFDN